MVRTYLAAVFYTALATSALAADLPVRTAPTPPMAVSLPAFSWTGFYVGINIGGIASQSDAKLVSASDGILEAEEYLGELFPRSFDLNRTGLIGGAQLGYNWQLGALVLGVEADLQATSLDKRASSVRSFGIPLLFGGYVDASARSQMSWFATARARVGFAIADRTMIYATGGLAMADLESERHADVYFSFLNESGPISTFSGKRSRTKTGWTLGGGFEHAVSANWTMKAEYLYYDLGDVTVVNRGTGFLAEEATTFKFRNDGHVFRIGLNYKFSGGSAVAPVVAAY